MLHEQLISAGGGPRAARVPTPGPIVYRPLTLSELAALKLPEPVWVVDDLLPAGSLTLFAGREKGGKSLLAADLTASVAGGEPVLDKAVRAGSTVLVPAEENLRDVWLRLQRRLGGDTDRPLHVLPVNRGEDDLLDLANPAALHALRDLILRLEPAVLVLDPFRELHRLSENDSDQMGPLLRPLRRLAHETDTAVVLIHHMSRAGSFRGSTVIRASCDQEWAFRRPEETDGGSTELTGTLTIEGRFGPRQVLGIRLGDDLRWQLSVQALATSPSARGQVLAFLADADAPATAQEIAGAVGAATKTVQNVIADERRKGHAPIRVIGAGRKDDPFAYLLDDAV